MLIIFLSELSAIYETTWKNMVESDRQQMAIRHMHFACWITKATDRHPEYITLIAFPPQQCLHERASLLNFTYISLHVTANIALHVTCMCHIHATKNIYTYEINKQAHINKIYFIIYYLPIRFDRFCGHHQGAV